MYKIGVIGDRESVLGFRAIGLDVFPCSRSEDAEKVLHRLAKEGYAIIYITEVLASEMIEDIDRYKEEMIPAVITIPGKEGSTGEGMRSVSKAVERAVGADILFGGENR